MINERNMSDIGPVDVQKAKHPLPVMRRIKSVPTAPANTRGSRQRARRRNIRLMLVLLGAPLLQT